MRVDHTAEARHEPTEALEWEESHRLDILIAETDVSPASSVSFQIGRHPNRDGGVASFLAAYMRKGELPIVISDLAVPLPADRWEIRTSGLWADHICETPMEHWSYGLEAFALAIDRADELLLSGVGDRVPLGWELEFESTKEAAPLGAEAYLQTGTAHGLLLTADGELEIEGEAVRSHWWGTGGPIELQTGGAHRPVHSRCVLPAHGGAWEQDAGSDGLRSRWV